MELTLHEVQFEKVTAPTFIQYIYSTYLLFI